jgi:hypothetical protein
VAQDIFGKNLITEDEIILIYSGEVFDNGIPIKSLITQLEALERLTRLSVAEFVSRSLIDNDIPDYQIFIKIESGSVKETIKVVFKSPWTYAILAYVVAPMINTTYEKALNVWIADKENVDVEDIIKTNPQLRNYCSELINPIATLGGELTIQSNGSEATYTQQQAKVIRTYLNEFEEQGDVEPVREGEFVESKVGTIRKTNLDDKNNNYFGFNIEGGEKGIPMSIKGEFNFNDYRDLIDKPVVITGIFRYKNDKVTHIQLDTYQIIDNITQLSIESVRTQD